MVPFELSKSMVLAWICSSTCTIDVVAAKIVSVPFDIINFSFVCLLWFNITFSHISTIQCISESDET